VETIDIDDAIDALEFGPYQYQILLAAGLCFAADAMEVLLLSFLSTILQVEWQLEGHQTDTIISVVFAGAIMGSLVLSPMGDRFGRKPLFATTSGIITVFGLFTALCSSYVPLLMTRFMVGFGVGGLVIP
jgi:MFS family permease